MLRHIETEHFKVRLHSPILEGGEKGISISENNPYGQNNVIHFKRSQIKELIALLRYADQEFEV